MAALGTGSRSWCEMLVQKTHLQPCSLQWLLLAALPHSCSQQNVFVQLSLAFRNDSYTLESRIHQAERERNLTEENTEKELENFKASITVIVEPAGWTVPKAHARCPTFLSHHVEPAEMRYGAKALSQAVFRRAGKSWGRDPKAWLHQGYVEASWGGGWGFPWNC